MNRFFTHFFIGQAIFSCSDITSGAVTAAAAGRLLDYYLILILLNLASILKDILTPYAIF
jgi:hypothetical protein